VPQRADYHPEVDTGIHILLVLDQAARLSADPRVRFAALMHDLGKGTTPAEFLPRHHGHEERSVRLLEDLCDRHRVPNDCRELAVIVARYHGLCHRADELRPETMLKLLQSTDAFRRPERFEQFLLACEADARGRLGLEDRPYTQAGLLRRARQAAVAVDTKALLERGLAGEAFAGELQQLRTDAIRALTQ
jgi:tRNA nucleotidyltransferase (CCA-adding enzyme)